MSHGLLLWLENIDRRRNEVVPIPPRVDRETLRAHHKTLTVSTANVLYLYLSSEKCSSLKTKDSSQHLLSCLLFSCSKSSASCSTRSRECRLCRSCRLSCWSTLNLRLCRCSLRPQRESRLRAASVWRRRRRFMSSGTG